MATGVGMQEFSGFSGAFSEGSQAFPGVFGEISGVSWISRVVSGALG